MAVKINARDLAEIGIALSFADGDIDPSEVAMLLLAMADLGIDEGSANAAVDAAVDRIEGGCDVDEMLARACAAVPVKLRPAVFEACVHILMGDGQLAEAEVQRLVAVKSLLAVDDAVVIRVIASAAVSAFEACGGLEVARA